MKLHTSAAMLRCVLSPDDALYRMHAVVDPGIVDFYRALVPKHVRLNKQRYAPHITVVKESYIPKVDVYRALDGFKFEFEYDYYTYFNETYWWLPVISEGLSNLREAMGLSRSSVYTRPPDGSDIFHITIGNTKGI